MLHNLDEERDQRVTMVKIVKSDCLSRLDFRLRGQFEIKILIVRLMNTKNWAWACDHLKSSNLSADSFKKTLELSGSIPEPAIRSGDTNQRIHCFDSCQLTATWMVTWMYNIRLQAPNLARKCEIKHWYACRADGQAVGLRSGDCQIFWDG